MKSKTVNEQVLERLRNQVPLSDFQRQALGYPRKTKEPMSFDEVCDEYGVISAQNTRFLHTQISDIIRSEVLDENQKVEQMFGFFLQFLTDKREELMEERKIDQKKQQSKTSAFHRIKQ